MSGFLETILAFMDKGGNVLWLIAILLFVMWTLIFERLWFFNFVWRKEVFETISAWENRSERSSWNAKQIRMRLLSVSREDIHANLDVITTLVAVLVPVSAGVALRGWRPAWADRAVTIGSACGIAVIVLVMVFVIPFFTILLFGPKLLEQKRIGIIFFMISCIFPLFMSIPIILMYFNVINKANDVADNSRLLLQKLFFSKPTMNWRM